MYSMEESDYRQTHEKRLGLTIFEDTPHEDVRHGGFKFVILKVFNVKIHPLKNPKIK
ncbi:hypothetical protein A2U01_0114441, partial [Trifolium medium]|nr:hypothetical protein [Trifolium medium]